MTDFNINSLSPSATSLFPSPEVHPHYENAVRDVLIAEKINTVDILESLKILPKEKSRLNIPLCHMISRPIVRPALQADVTKLEADFVHGYRDWEKVFHVSITDEDGNHAFVTPDVSQSWSDNWKCVNDQFEVSLKADVDLIKFNGKMFLSSMEITGFKQGNRTSINFILTISNDIILWTPSFLTFLLMCHKS